MAGKSDHPRNLGPMQAAQRCGARTRAGTPCQSPSIAGGARCRMHGGKGSGAPKGNRNAFKHGCFTGVILAQNAEVRQVVRRVDLLLRDMDARAAARDVPSDNGR